MNRKLGTKVTWAVYTLPGPVSSATRPIGAVQMTNPAARMCTVRGVERPVVQGVVGDQRWRARFVARAAATAGQAVNASGGQPADDRSGGDDDRERHGEH